MKNIVNNIIESLSLRLCSHILNSANYDQSFKNEATSLKNKIINDRKIYLRVKKIEDFLKQAKKKYPSSIKQG